MLFRSAEIDGKPEERAKLLELFCVLGKLVFIQKHLDIGTLEKLRAALLAVERKAPITETSPPVPSPKWALTPREAIFAPSEIIPVDRSLGRVSAAAAISCPPAVPIAVCGEMIDECVVRNFKYYGIEKCAVIK